MKKERILLLIQSAFSRIIGLLCGVFITVSIPNCLDADSVGKYYLFAAVISISVVFEGGMSYSICQHLSRFAGQKNSQNSRLEYDELSIRKVSSLVQNLLRGLANRSLWMFLIVNVYGFYNQITFESQFHSSIAIQWALVGIAAISSMFSLCCESVLEALGFIKISNQVKILRIVSFAIGTLSILYFARSGFAFVVGTILGSILSILIAFKFISQTSIVDISSIFTKNSKNSLSLLSENRSVAFSRRIRISWISGFFIGNCYTIISAHVSGKAVAGKIGYLLQIISAIISLGTVTIQMSTPFYGAALAKKDFGALRKEFVQSSRIAMLVVALGFLIFITIKSMGLPLLERVFRYLPSNKIVILSFISAWLTVVTTAQASYIRSQIVDPYFKISIANAFITPLAIILACLFFPQDGVFYAYIFNTVVVSVIPSVFVYKRYMTCNNKLIS